MMTAVAAARLSESLQTLVDSRLDTIDRMLLGRVPRQDRLAIVKDVEAQVFDLLQDRDVEELSRDDVLAVLARLDPPEAYLSDEVGDNLVPVRRELRPRVARRVRTRDPKVAKASGILGLLSIGLILSSPLYYLIAVAFNSELVLLVFGAGSLFLTAMASIL